MHAPMMQVFGEASRVSYSIAGGQTFVVDGIFDAGARPVSLIGEPEVNEVRPLLGVRLAQFPAGWNPRNAKDDTFVVRGATYVVKDGKPDSHGWAILEAALQ
ncbi:MAG: head-tail joining protein [Dokdonella sp.]|uniref:head-tail joining protein n=1 Tax=Dokdonella sp. TaxID=2291710 RepID=UPI003F7F8041